METYTIYYDPIDYPGKFVVRRFEIANGIPEADPEPLIVTDSIHAARNAVPDQCDTLLPRSPADNRSVVETWI